MNKLRPIQEIFYAIMRLTFTQMLIMVALTSLTSAAHLNTNAQEILKRHVSLSVKDQELREVLSEIEEQTSVVFTYQSKIIKPSRKISLEVKNATLGDVLAMLFGSSISLVAIDDEEEIVLRPSNPERDEVEASVEVDTYIALTVEGKVTDESGEALPGVNVLEKGTTNGTTTDVNGKFALNVRDESSVIVFSFIGYTTQEITIGNQTSFDVFLVSDVQTLSEVVVVGYGEQKRETLTGSVSNIKGEEITKSPSVNVTTSLAGRLPGLIINQRNGVPGRENLDIMIRGMNTMDSNPNDGINPNAPLIIIDGVPRDNLSRLNPDDVESISVLKDGSAAIYGARGANGVILVTTKKGSQGAPTFSFSYGYALTKPTKIPDMLDAATFAEAYNEAEWYRQGRPDMGSFNPFFSDDAIQKYRDGSDPVLYPNTDWANLVTKNYSHQQRVNLQASGGSEKVRYLLSFGMTDQDGNFENDPTNYRQYNTRVRVDVDLTEHLTVGANINAIINERNYPGQPLNPTQPFDFVNLLQSNPTLVARYPNGLLAPGRFRNNPLLIDQSGFNKIQDYPLNTTFTATYKAPFLEGLTVDATYNYDLRNEFEKLLEKPFYYHEYNVQTGEYDRMITPGRVNELRDDYRKWTTSLVNLRFSYRTTIGQDHNLAVMLGGEQQKGTYNALWAYRMNNVSAAVPQIDVGSRNAEDKDNGGTGAESAYINYLGRLNYDFKSKYLFEFVFRYDGSSIFPKDNRFGFFPAVSAGWRLSEENFISGNLPFVNELKLRGSYGELGNDRVPGYQFLQAFEFGNAVLGGSGVPAIVPSTLPNPNITWEVSKKLDIGLVAELWDGLLGVDLTYFRQNRSNILWPRNLSISRAFGFPALPHENIGKVNNHGFELVLSHRNQVGDLVYSVSANSTFARSKIINMDEVPPAEPYQAATGHPVGSDLYYKADGIFHTLEELNSYPHGNGAQVGDIKVLDLNDDGQINGDDRYRTNKSATPEYVFGLTTNFQYKGFDLTLFFQGQTGALSYDNVLTEFGQQDLDNNTVYRATDRWTANNQQGTMPRADAWEPGATDFFLYDATFIRLKNLELGYSFRNMLAKGKSLDDVRLFVSGTNLLTWAKEIKWRDPEIRGGFTEYPPLRIINFGVDVKF
jgi:TonB-linked SusC/RagA family outer membrane protein